ncbi:stage II sporulation protein P [Clostridium arbusti]|uniref:stage II sporulation protein P n=1 Tax=Clostridium arbusti TaxID=1137848 RepID=UPI000289E156|nr:stage II sporulation protein P [Clostridium arbusti]
MVNKKINNEKNSFILILGITIIIFSTYLFFSFFNERKNQERLIDGTANMIYVQLMNYAVPVIKIANFHESNTMGDTPSLKTDILNYMGIDLHYPDKILKKEVSYLDEDRSSIYYNDNEDGTAAIGDFNLSNDDIIKNSVGSTPTTNSSNLNTPTQTSKVYNPSLKKTLDNSKPEVLIYHSHTTEGYGKDGQDNLDPTKNVTAIGDVLTNTLENDYGISVVHDKTIHNALSYNNSYERSGQTVDNYLKQYGGFKMIIDLDRDSDPNKSDVTKEINGENAAKFTFVMAKNNPHFNQNMTMVNLLLNTANSDFPGLTIGNGINYFDNGTNFFNQDKSNNAFLLEIGSAPNTMDESKTTTNYVARMIAEYLNTEQFINTVAPAAEDTYKKDKIFPSVTLAQAMLESGEGTSALTKKANNLFGIKAFSWPGKIIQMPTRENYKGINVVIMGKFRAYDNWTQSVEDHGSFLVNNNTYKKHGVFAATSYTAQAKALQSAGYATDPGYAQKLIGLIKEYNLNQFDNVK